MAFLRSGGEAAVKAGVDKDSDINRKPQPKRGRAKAEVAAILAFILAGCTHPADATSPSGTLNDQTAEPGISSGVNSTNYTPSNGNSVTLPPITEDSSGPAPTSENTQPSTETCDGEPKPVITGKPDPNDTSHIMQAALEMATPNPITSRANLSFTVICLTGGTPPWQLVMTDGINKSPYLNWRVWGSDAGNTTYGQ